MDILLSEQKNLFVSRLCGGFVYIQNRRVSHIVLLNQGECCCASHAVCEARDRIALALNSSASPALMNDRVFPAILSWRTPDFQRDCQGRKDRG